MGAVGESNAFKLVNDFYDAHNEVVASKSRNIAGPDADAKLIDDSLNGFSESTRVLLKGLTALGQLHPFVAGSFHSCHLTSYFLTNGPSCGGRICAGGHHGLNATR